MPILEKAAREDEQMPFAQGECLCINLGENNRSNDLMRSVPADLPKFPIRKKRRRSVEEPIGDRWVVSFLHLVPLNAWFVHVHLSTKCINAPGKGWPTFHHGYPACLKLTHGRRNRYAASLFEEPM